MGHPNIDLSVAEKYFESLLLFKLIKLITKHGIKCQ